MAETIPTITKVGLVMLGVSDMARSVAFYRDQLGLAMQMESPEFTFLNGGGVTLALSAVLAKALGGATPGATEIVFSVESVTAVYEALRARGVQFKNEPRQVTGPMWGANFDDPDGHHLSLFGPKM